MGFPQGPSGSSSILYTTVASNNTRESSTTEFLGVGGLGATTFKVCYVFVPKVTGEIRITLDAKSSAGSGPNIAVLSSTFPAGSVLIPTPNTTTPLDTNVVYSGMTTTTIVPNASLGVNYATYTSVINVVNTLPIYIGMTFSATAGVTVGLTNIKIQYDRR